MRLKCIRLAGFKSFVDPTTASFPSNMTAVVGPNGCGKSNVIDAVRWVLGESSAKNLRGESMTDVIFNGSNSRKPISQASIELVFDNSDGGLLGEYAAYGEISVKRKVTRDGQSLYFLNGTKCRRRDITDLFLGTGLGPRSYAIIEQGMISRLVEARPDDLRIFIEEAAGISKYKERRRETESRIRRTHENLARLTDLREELGRQLERLQRQAHAAQRYTEFKQQERQLKAELCAIRWRDLDNNGVHFEQIIAQQETALEALIAEQRHADALIEQIRDSHHDLTEHFNQVQASYYAVAAEIARIEQTITHHQQRSQQLQNELREADYVREEAQQHLAQDQQNLAAVEQQLAQLTPDYEMLMAQAEQASERLMQAQENFERSQKQWEQVAAQSQVPMRQADVQRARISQLQDMLLRLQQRLAKLDAEQASYSDDPYSLQLEEKQAQLLEMQAHNQEQQEQDVLLQHRLQAQRQLISQLQQQQQQLVHQEQQVNGEKIKLEALQQAALNPSNEANQWLAQQQLTELPRLLEQIRVHSRWQSAVELVLGKHLQARVLNLAQLPEKLPEQGNLLLHFARKTNNAAPANSLLRQVTTELDLSVWLEQVLVADNIAQARSMLPNLKAGQSVITAQGVWLSNDFLAIEQDNQAQGSVLERAEQIEALTQQLTALAQQLHSLNQQLEQAKQQLLELEQQQQMQRDLSVVQNNAVAKLQSEIAILHNQNQQWLERSAQLQIELAEAAENLAIEQENLASAELLLAEANEQIAQFSEQQEQLQAQREQARQQLEQQRAQLSKVQNQAHQVEVMLKSLSVEEKSIRQALERLEQQFSKALARHEQLSFDLASGQSPVDELKAKLEEQLSIRLERDDELRNARTKLEESDLQVREQERKRTQAEQQAQVLRSQVERQRLDLQTVDVKRKTLQEQLRSEGYDLDSVLLLLAGDASESAWQSQLEQVHERITRLGAINLAAIEEYSQQSERKNYLDAQDADLNEALSTLENVIRKIDKETRNRFKETFDQINNGLQSLFPKVFGGGQAYLQLTGEDLLDTGVAIMARPPGKKNSTIHLLSGGEKALTALALVFAIFQLNPAPFCMLDEVDAPLDDANVGRYARLVKEMSATVQFIYITHNKIAMEMADQLLGVTMHEPGCSRLVAVNIEEAAAMAES